MMMRSSKDLKPIEEHHTIGEELFLVHLQRTSAPDAHPEEAEDDHDLPHPREPTKTVGEELFNVHLKRSQGMDPDYDVDIEQKKSDHHLKTTESPYALRSKDKQVKVNE